MKPGPKPRLLPNPATGTVDAFPLVLAAAKKRDGSAWDLGAALIKECGNPGSRCKGSDGKDGSHARVAAARAVLLADGIDYRLTTLLDFRAVAFAFPPSARHPGLDWSVHRHARSPEKLREIIAGVPKGESVTVAYVRRINSEETGKTARKPGKVQTVSTPAPVSISALMAPLVAALKMQTKAVRIAALVELMEGIEVELVDFGAIGGSLCQLRRSFPMTTPMPVEARAVA